MSVHSTTVDSADKNAIQYIEPVPPLSSGLAWSFNQSGTLLGAVFDSTLSECIAAGASVVFTFNGSSVHAFGSVENTNGNAPPVSTYSVDGGSPTSFTAPQVEGRRDAVQFFASAPLPLGNHTLIINITSSNSAAPYYLDYLQYGLDEVPVPSSSTVSATSSTESPSQTSDSPIVSTTSGLEIAETKHIAPTSAIVGGVVGGLAFLCLLLALHHWRRTRRPSGEFRYGTKAHQDAPPITPFLPTASIHSPHGGPQNPSLVPSSRVGSVGPPSRSDGGDTMSELPSTETGATFPTSNTHTTGVSIPPPPPSTPEGNSTSRGDRRLTQLSYMRPPSTTHDGYFTGWEGLSDQGRGEDLPAYTPS
ncbi:hypothetical protein C8Q79DRAFT_601470 [Trametes meyenii]|nr:hypothetical protein C8Q79DRAFT_601470 [Trametes meyenii]